MNKAERAKKEQQQAVYQAEQAREAASRKPKDQIVTLCLLQRSGKIDLDEFGERLAAMLQDPDSVVNIAIDVEQLFDNQIDALHTGRPRKFDYEDPRP